jgi:hypothetical protein
MTWTYQETKLLTPADLEQAGEWARHSGMDPRRIFVTGASQVEHLAPAR